MMLISQLASVFQSIWSSDFGLQPRSRLSEVAEKKSKKYFCPKRKKYFSVPENCAKGNLIGISGRNNISMEMLF